MPILSKGPVVKFKKTKKARKRIFGSKAIKNRYAVKDPMFSDPNITVAVNGVPCLSQQDMEDRIADVIYNDFYHNDARNILEAWKRNYHYSYRDWYNLDPKRSYLYRYKTIFDYKKELVDKFIKDILEYNRSKLAHVSGGYSIVEFPDFDIIVEVIDNRAKLSRKDQQYWLYGTKSGEPFAIEADGDIHDVEGMIGRSYPMASNAMDAANIINLSVLDYPPADVRIFSKTEDKELYDFLMEKSPVPYDLRGLNCVSGDAFQIYSSRKDKTFRSKYVNATPRQKQTQLSEHFAGIVESLGQDIEDYVKTVRGEYWNCLKHWRNEFCYTLYMDIPTEKMVFFILVDPYFNTISVNLDHSSNDLHDTVNDMRSFEEIKKAIDESWGKWVDGSILNDGKYFGKDEGNTYGRYKF